MKPRAMPVNLNPAEIIGESRARLARRMDQAVELRGQVRSLPTDSLTRRAGEVSLDLESEEISEQAKTLDRIAERMRRAREMRR